MVADRGNLDDYLKEPIRRILGESYEVLPQSESIFTARVIAFDDFDQLFKRFRTIIFFANLDDPSTLTDFVISNLGEQNTARALNDNEFYYALKKDVWAEPQLILFVFASNKQKLLERINMNLQKIINIVQANELGKYRNNVYIKGLNNSLTNSLKMKHQIALNIPKDFVLAVEQDQFLWIRDITPESSNNMMISYRPLNYTKPSDPIAWRNELGRTYISSNISGAYMLSDTILPFQYDEVNVNGLVGTEIRGLWKMDGDFMGGPFLCYHVIDKKNNREILLDGFVYAPGDKKKPRIRALEAIFSDFNIVESGKNKLSAP